MSFCKFPDDFLWGAASSSCQIEGAAFEDGKGESIWDRFSHIPGKIVEDHTPAIACDHYHRFAEDVALMKLLKLGAYRFSIAWPRIFPDGKGGPNRRGLDFYERLVDELLEAGIEPMATLYHWDLPQSLEDRGGWTARDTAKYFTDYAACMFEALGDRVDFWITHNEPWVAATLGYGTGEHAPGISHMPSALTAAHNILISHGSAVGAFRELSRKGSQIGITLNMSPVYPASSDERDILAAKRWDGCLNRWYADPVFLGSYPEDIMKLYSGAYGSPDVDPEEMKIIATPIDFLGVNYYSRALVKADPEAKPLGLSSLNGDRPQTAMGWEVYPEGLYDLLLRIQEDYAPPAIFITENGAAYDDQLELDGSVNDDERRNYVHAHLVQLHEAMEDGAKVRGYFLWSILDNFEWAFGYSRRFGIIYVDYNTLARIPKESAKWYRNVIQSGGVSC